MHISTSTVQKTTNLAGTSGSTAALVESLGSMTHWFFMGLLAAAADATKDLVSKQTMRSASPYLVTWSLFAVAAPLLAAVALLSPLPPIEQGFAMWVGITSVLFTGAVLLYMRALKASDISITLPMIAFTPSFMLFTGSTILGELPNLAGICGVVIIVVGAYLLNLRDVRKGIFKPITALAKEPGPRMMLGVAVLFSITATTAKNAVLTSSPLVAFAAMYCVAAVIISAVVFVGRKVTWADISRNWRGVLAVGFLMALSELGMAHALSMTLAVYAVSVKRLSILVGALYGVFILREKNVSLRLIGASVMLGGVILIALSSR